MNSNALTKASAICTWLAIWTTLAFDFAAAQTTVVQSEGVAAGKVVVVDPAARSLTIMTEPGHVPMSFYGLERARIETSTGRSRTLAELRPETPLAVYYIPYEGRWYAQRVLIPDANIAFRHLL